MVRRQTLMQLSDDIVAALDRVADSRGVSRSEVAREALQTYLSRVDRDTVDDAMRRGYAQHPQLPRDEWGDLAAGADPTPTMLRLQAEEAAAGHEPW